MSNANEPAFAKPAFSTADGYGSSGSDGLTKREYAAIQIMAGYCANHEHTDRNQDKLSNWAVMQADSLLAELAK